VKNYQKEKFVVANWKMNKTVSESLEFLKEFKRLVGRSSQVLKKVGVAIAPVFTSIPSVYKALSGSEISVSAQDVFWEGKGAYTGEISPLQLRDVGVEYVIVGHSERRKYLKESDEMVANKVLACLENSLIPIMCVGESLGERKSGRMKSVVERQVTKGLSKSIDMLKESASLVVAYEPVWAIGTGIPASADDILDAHSFIEAVLDSLGLVGIKIIYGGSVNPDFAKEIAQITSGALVGGASLEPTSFWGIIEGFYSGTEF
jgi:triosephosphate isomerase